MTIVTSIRADEWESDFRDWRRRRAVILWFIFFFFFFVDDNCWDVPFYFIATWRWLWNFDGGCWHFEVILEKLCRVVWYGIISAFRFIEKEDLGCNKPTNLELTVKHNRLSLHTNDQQMTSLMSLSDPISQIFKSKTNWDRQFSLSIGPDNDVKLHNVPSIQIVAYDAYMEAFHRASR